MFRFPGELLPALRPAHGLGNVQPNGETCPFCDGRGLRPFSVKPSDGHANSGRVHLLECASCEVAWQWPVVRSDVESRSYFAGQYAEKEQGSYFSTAERRSIAQLQVGFVNSAIGLKGALLDVGAGDGMFVEVAAEQGWLATGLEPAEIQSDAIMISHHNARLIRGTLDQIPPGEQFDVIALWDVIEHVERPMELLRSARSHLRDGGTIIVETGNFQSAGRILGGDSWWDYQLDHRWYFSPQVVAQMLCALGLCNIGLAERVMRPWWKGLPGARAPSAYAMGKQLLRNPASAVKQWKWLRQLQACCRKWPHWSGMEILTMSGSPVAQVNSDASRSGSQG